MRSLTIVGIIFLSALASVASAQVGDDDHVLPADDAALEAAWGDLETERADQITTRNMHGVVRAIHKYIEANGTFPPAQVANDELPADKRLSGLVLLLPYLGEATRLHDGDEGPAIFDPAFAAKAKELYESIDLTKAWDDPVNLEAARTLVPAFLIPGATAIRDENGLAVSHVGFVLGAAGEGTGVFFGAPRSIADITDGTVQTLAIGQIHEQPGPWIAAGSSTARFVFHPDSETGEPTFSGEDTAGCFFANCDSSSYFRAFSEIDSETLAALAAYADGTYVFDQKIGRYQGKHDFQEKQGR
ncbi:MAG: hypothetical protein ACR2NP_02520 [Pirellulaceae bacterium]